MLIFFNW